MYDILDERNSKIVIRIQSSEFLMAIAQLFQNIKKNLMSGPPKYTNPPFPLRLPYAFPMMNPNRLINLPSNLPRNGNLPQQPQSGAQIQAGTNSGFPFLPNRPFNPYMGGLGMTPFPPYIPYSPFGRPPNSQHNPQMPPTQEIRSKPINESSSGKARDHQSIEVIDVDQNQKGSISKKQNAKKVLQSLQKEKTKIQEPFKKKISTPKQNLKSSSSQQKKIIVDKSTKYTPYDSKKKMKKQLELNEPIVERKTREKRPCIEKLYLQIMKQKPQRDMVMKIGKEHQATIPQSYLNQYQYTLKIKIEKKKSLLSRMIQGKHYDEMAQNTPLREDSCKA